MERLYTLAYLREKPDFDPSKWSSMTAEDMWNQGAATVFEAAVPGCTAKVRSILSMTAAGAHDKPAPSETDIHDAIKYLSQILTPLRVGDG